MKRKVIHLMFILFLGGLIVSCNSNSGNKNVEAVSSEQLAKQINESLPEQIAEKVHPGKAVYTKYCLTCHMSDGSGVPGMHPPLGPGSWVENDPVELIAIMMKGLSGKIEVNGEIYKNFMPSHASLTDQEIADVLSYIRSSFGNNLDPVSADMVKKYRSGR
jgi:mono/diheme cytochrome c family protein